MTPRMHIALFDLDHTLLPLDSDYSWGSFTTRLGWTDPVEFDRQNEVFFQHYQAGTLDIQAYVRFATRAVRERSPDEVQRAQAQFMREVIEPQIRPAARALIEGHRQAGHEVVIVTATNALVTRPIATAFGVEHLIAVELEHNAAGQLTGGIAGTPSFREGKVARVEGWLAARGASWETVHTTFYSDSTNDLPLLNKATVPVATNPSPALRAVARERQWRILDLFAEHA